MQGVRFFCGTAASRALRRSMPPLSTSGSPSRSRQSKKNTDNGSSPRTSATSSLRPKRRIVTWKGWGLPSGRKAIASPSRISERAVTAPAAPPLPPGQRGRRRDRLQHDAFQRALAKLADDKAREEILLLRRRAFEQLGEPLFAPGRRALALDCL